MKVARWLDGAVSGVPEMLGDHHDPVAELEALLAAVPSAGEGHRWLDQTLPELSAQLGLTWVAAYARSAGGDWNVVSERGRPTERPSAAFLSTVCDREESCTTEPEAGCTQVYCPLPVRLSTAAVLVGQGRTPDSASATELSGGFRYLVRSVSLALGTAEICWQAREQSERLTATLEIASHLAIADDIDPLLETIAREATRLLGCDRSTIFLWNQDRGEVEARPAIGIPDEQLRLSDKAGIVGETLRSGRSLLIPDAYADPRFNDAVDRKSGYRTGSLICVPLREPNGPVCGAFQAINPNHGGAFRESDVQCLELLGTQASVALRHLRERNLLNRSRSQLAEAVQSNVRIVGDSPAVTALRDTVSRLGHTDLPVLILGESGTGKEVVAQALHYGGARADCPFVAVNCAAINESLLESELFGHEEGAFTDARSTRQGKFELADGGTLFLDEIGDMSLGGQAKLLRVLEQKVITRVGGSQSVPVDVRIVAATNANLPECVRDRKFREDLYYRLSVVTLELPPLRDRPEDILPLAEYFLAQFSEQARRKSLQLSNDARRRLQSHLWPGNIRELRNLMERVAFLCGGDRVEADDLAFILSPEEDHGQLPPLDAGLDVATRQFQRDYIRRAITHVRNNMTDAAKLLNLHRSNLYRKMKQLEMEEVGGAE